MTEIKLRDPLYFSACTVTSNNINRQIGRYIYHSPAWAEKIGHEGLTRETEPVEFTYTSKRLAYIFLSEIQRKLSFEREIPQFEDASLRLLCNLAFEYISLLGEDGHFDASDTSVLKQYFLTSLIFGMCSDSNTAFNFLSWQSRRWVISKITLHYERSQEVSSIVAEHFTSLAINSSENSEYTVYPTGTIQKYEIGETTVYSKIPETIQEFLLFLECK